MDNAAAPHTVCIDSCWLEVSDQLWPFATANSETIDAFWHRSVEENPALFDGEVFVLPQWSLVGGRLTGQLVPTRFAAYLYWRSTGFAGAACSEAFATAVVIAADGGVLAARASEGSLNGGRLVTPGGLLDRADIVDGRSLDPAHAAARELREETGLDAAAMSREVGYLIAYAPPYLAVASIFRSSLAGADVISQVGDYLASQDVPELHEPRLLRQRAELANLSMPTTTRLLLETQLL